MELVTRPCLECNRYPTRNPSTVLDRNSPPVVATSCSIRYHFTVIYISEMDSSAILMALKPQPYITLDEYFARQRESETRSEYVNGEIVAMTGGSLDHSRIISNVHGTLFAMVRGSGCSVFASDLCVQVEETEACFYPDILLVCGEPRIQSPGIDVLLNPGVIIEVLSHSTETRDRGSIFAHYRRIESLQEYWLVTQHAARVEQYTRLEDGRWILTEVLGVDENVSLLAGKFDMPMAAIYENVEIG